MQLTQSLGLRPELRQILTPRMIQSMEILQLPLQKLEERIEQELQNNPVLELSPGETDLENIPDSANGEAQAEREARSEGERTLVVKEGGNGSEDFERLARISEYLESDEFQTNTYFRPTTSFDGERDKKMDAMNNTAARGVTLQEHLLGQWAFVECPPNVRKAGEAIINYIDAEGYFRADFEQVKTESTKVPLTILDLQEALRLVQTLEPPGIGARNLRECLLLQL